MKRFLIPLLVIIMCASALLSFTPASAYQVIDDPVVTSVLMEAAASLALDTAPDCTGGNCAWLDPINATLTLQNQALGYYINIYVQRLDDYGSASNWVANSLGSAATEYSRSWGSGYFYFLEQFDTDYQYHTALMPCGNYGITGQVIQTLGAGGSLPEPIQPDIWMVMDALDSASNRWGLCSSTGQPAQTATCSWDETRMKNYINAVASSLGWSERAACGTRAGMIGYCCEVLHYAGVDGRCEVYDGGPISLGGDANNSSSEAIYDVSMLAICAETDLLYTGGDDERFTLQGIPAQLRGLNSYYDPFIGYNTVFWDTSCAYRLEGGVGTSCHDQGHTQSLNWQNYVDASITYASALIEQGPAYGLRFDGNAQPAIDSGSQPVTSAGTEDGASSPLSFCSSGAVIFSLAGLIIFLLKQKTIIK